MKRRRLQRWELLAKKLEEYGGRVVLNACAGELLTENGRICGVLAVDGQSGEQTAYYGKGGHHRQQRLSGK